VIIGKLIPAGTGATRYQSIQPDLPEASVLPSNLGADWLASLQMPGEEGEPNGELAEHGDTGTGIGFREPEAGLVTSEPVD